MSTINKDSVVIISIVITSQLKSKKKIFKVFQTDQLGLLYGWSETANDYTLVNSEFEKLLGKFIEITEEEG